MAVMNVKLMTNPLNWVTIAIWLFVGGLVLAATGITQAPTNTST